MSRQPRKEFPSTTAIVCALAAIGLAGCASTPQESWDGLEPVSSRVMDGVWVNNEVNIPAYQNVMIDPVKVEFSQNWDPNSGTRSLSGRVTQSDIEAIRQGIADEFQKVFKEELARNGYQVVTAPSHETLRVSAGIIDVQIAAPDTMQAGTRTYTQRSGGMTLVMELSDSVTGERLARAVDRQEDMGTGGFQVTNRGTNLGGVRSAMRIWANELVKGLNELNGR